MNRLDQLWSARLMHLTPAARRLPPAVCVI
jgi:hypothetical protein